MLKDIELDISIGAGAGIAITCKINEDLEESWEVYLINQGNLDFSNVLVTCKGYGIINNEERTTSTMRYFLGDVPTFSAKLIEPVNAELFVLHNEYFITFYMDGNIFDKKIIFPAHSISTDVLAENSILGMKALVKTL